MLRPVFGRSHWQLALALILAVVFSGVIGYRLLVPEFSFIDALYQTMVTLTTVGYNDQADQMTGHDPGVKLFTLGILMFGVFAVTYAFSILMRALIEGELREAIGNRRTRRRVRFMKHHYIVCGCGRMGGLIARRLHEDGKAVVVIDIDSKKKSQLDEEGIVCVIGDATTDEVLREAAIDQARGLIAVTDSDPENLFITMSARQLNPNMTIVSRALTDEAERKLLRAGASRVILPYKIGAHQLVQAALRPNVVDFIEIATRTSKLDIEMEEMDAALDSELAGRALKEATILRDLGLIVIGIRSGKDRQMQFNPSASAVINGGDTLIVLGKPDGLKKLRKLLA